MGTDHDDRIVGTRGPDVIVALKGRDAITARGGQDYVCAGRNGDLVDDGPGADHVFTQRGDDAVVHARGDDVLNGGRHHAFRPHRSYGGDTMVYGDAARHGLALDVDARRADLGNETDTVARFEHFEATRFTDRILGGPGDEVFDTLAGRDRVDAGGGRDVISSGGGADRVTGGQGHDRALLGGGVDHYRDKRGANIVTDGARPSAKDAGLITTGSAKDRIFLAHGRFLVSTGNDEDRILLDDTVRAATINEGRGRDTIRIRGGRVVSEEPFVIRLGRGDDTFKAHFYDRGSQTTVYGGRGTDVIDATPIAVPVSLTLGASGLITTIGTVLALSFEDAIGGKSGDTIVGSSEPNRISSGPGDDTVSGLGGDDTIDGGNGDDTADGGEGTDTCTNVEAATSCE